MKSAVLIGIVIVAGMFACLYLQHRLPETEEMHGYFAQHQSEFKTTNRLLLSQLKTSESIDPKQPDAVAYRHIEATRLPSAVIRYFTHFRGIGVASFGTGIAYLEKSPDKLYPDLQAMQQEATEVEGFLGYGHLSGNWYYFRWEAD